MDLSDKRDLVRDLFKLTEVEKAEQDVLVEAIIKTINEKFGDSDE